MIGLDYANHAALRINNGQAVQIVLVEHLGQVVLLQVGGAGEHAGLGEDGKGARILARLSKYSWDALALKRGSQVFAQVKAVALERN